jgi:thiol-disulfide isomerase/thioredoxin
MWASWCGPCLEELPIIDAFARRARERGIAVLSLALDTDYRGGGRVPAVLHDRAPHLTPIIARFDDASAFMSMFSREWEGTIPALFVFDRAGKLRKSWFQPVEAPELEQLIEQLGDGPRAPRGNQPGAATIHL